MSLTTGEQNSASNNFNIKKFRTFRDKKHTDNIQRLNHSLGSSIDSSSSKMISSPPPRQNNRLSNNKNLLQIPEQNQNFKFYPMNSTYFEMSVDR